MAKPTCKLYHDLAPVAVALATGNDVNAECVWRLLTLGREPATVLELGSGGGNTSSHLKGRVDLTLVDRS